jgi:hypothetical protein
VVKGSNKRAARPTVFAFFLPDFDNLYPNISSISENKTPILLNTLAALIVTNKPYVVIMKSDK